MKILLTSLALAGLWVLPANAAGEKDAKPAAEAKAEAEDPDQVVEDTMETMGKAMKALRKHKPGEGMEECAEWMRKAQVACIRSASVLPAEIREMEDGPEKFKIAADYRRLMGLQLASLAELETAYLSGDPEKVAAVTKKVFKVKKEAHGKYED